ncbi:MAG: AMP-binding protein, partial [Pyrinomonadaceae bacterium]
MQEETVVAGAFVEGFRLSPLQERVWGLMGDGASGGAYRAQCAVHVEGRLDAAALRRAAQQVTDRHEILRTTFRLRPEMRLPLQVVADAASPAWREVSLHGRDAREQEAGVASLFDEERRRPADFTQPSLLRLCLVALSTERHVLLVGLPALCADERTLSNLVGEIALAYGDAAARPRETPDGAAQYVQFSEWQNQMLDSEDAREGREYWRARDLSSLYTLALPFGSGAGRGTGYEPESVALDTGRGETTARVLEVARRYQTSTATVLLACWQTLLWRLTEHSDIAVGKFYDGRTFDELQGALGLFARWLPVQCRFYGNLRFSEIIRQVEESASEVSDWQDYFYPGGNARHLRPAFPSFGFEFGEQPPEHACGGVNFTVARQECDTDRFKLKLTARLSEVGLALEVRYDPASYGRGEAVLLGEYFCELVRSAAREPEGEVGRLNMLDERHLRRALVEWNETCVEIPRAAIHELFEQVASSSPDSPALSHAGTTLSYGELNRRANRLAHRLRELGVGVESRVGLCLPRSPELVVSMLATLKAGGAYVPLDASYPVERQRLMLDGAGVSHVVSRSALSGSLPAHWSQVVELDDPDEAAAVAAQPADDPRAVVSPDTLAYVIYTSGSTGGPKAVGVTHANVVRLARGQAYARLDATRVLAQLAPATFDASTFEVWGSLLNGARLAVIDAEAPTARELGRGLRREGVTTLWLTAGLFHLLAEEGVGELRGLEQLLAGGDVLSARHVRRYLEECGGEVVNGYGPTESTTFACCRAVRTGEELGRGVPIGRPIAN